MHIGPVDTDILAAPRKRTQETGTPMKIGQLRLIDSPARVCATGADVLLFGSVQGSIFPSAFTRRRTIRC